MRGLLICFFFLSLMMSTSDVVAVYFVFCISSSTLSTSLSTILLIPPPLPPPDPPLPIRAPMSLSRFAQLMHEEATTALYAKSTSTSNYADVEVLGVEIRDFESNGRNGGGRGNSGHFYHNKMSSGGSIGKEGSLCLLLLSLPPVSHYPPLSSPSPPVPLGCCDHSFIFLAHSSNTTSFLSHFLSHSWHNIGGGEQRLHYLIRASMLEYSSIIPSTNTSNTTTTINNNNNNNNNNNTSNSGSSSNLPIPNGLPVSVSPIGQGRKEGKRSSIASMHDRQGSVSLFPAMPTASQSLPPPPQLPSSLSMPMRSSLPVSSTTKDDESSSSVSSHLRIPLPSERGGGGLRGMDAMMVDDVHQPRQVTPSLIYTP